MKYSNEIDKLFTLQVRIELNGGPNGDGRFSSLDQLMWFFNVETREIETE